MAGFVHDVDKYNKLPPFPRQGPKLDRFKGHLRGGRVRHIDYIASLTSDIEEQSTSFQPHSYVFEVLIDGVRYALKIFRFHQVEDVRLELAPDENPQVSDDMIKYQSDPFYAECTAYGIIKQKTKKRRQPIAVPCHGFLSIPATDEEFLSEKFGISEWNRPDKEYELPPALRSPFRAIVKDFVDSNPLLTDSEIRSMAKDLKDLHNKGIYVMDVKYANYVGGLLVDFSSSWTNNHYMFRPGFRSKIFVQTSKRSDYYDFDAMVKELNVQTSFKLAPKPDLYSTRLRQR